MKTLNFILYGNIFIALCAFTQTLQTYCFLEHGKPPLSILSFFVAAATFFLYNIHKPITFFLKKQFAENQRFLKTKMFSTPLSILTALSGIFCFYAFFQIQRATQLSLIVAVVLSLAYVLPVLGRLRLRDLPYVKIFTIAFVWAFVTVILPVCELGQTINIGVSLMFLERALFIFALTIPFDIRDMDWDERANLKTIPLSIGIAKAQYLAILCLIICVGLDFILNRLTIYDFKTIIILNISYLISSIAIYATKENRSDYYFYGLIDGMMLMQSLVIILI
jgi:4-hydroxybenzoate polyprenyltransferase